MNTSKQVLRLLAENQEGYLSGEELARRLGISRAAVWKAVSALRDAGYEIQSRTNRGYRIVLPCDLLDAEKIQKALTGPLRGPVTVLPECDSTNNVLRQMAADGAPEGSIVLADQQTAGKGRMGRSFHSPDSSGVYMSILLRPQFSLEQLQLVTIMAALSVSDALRETAGMRTEIKWVNDILYRGKKLCGILTEGNFDGESGRLEYLVVGIGINVTGALPAPLSDIATTVKAATERDISRCALASAVANMLGANYLRLHRDPAGILAQYKAQLCMLGQEITVIAPSGSYRATAYDLSADGGLMVRRADGVTETLRSGEISTRLVPQTT